EQAAGELDERTQPLPRFETPIVPKATIAGRALVAVIAIMTFLAALTTGAVLLVRAAASDWQADVSREVTIQIRPTSGRDLAADAPDAATVGSALPCIAAERQFLNEAS